MSRCCICGQKVYAGEYADYWDNVREKTLYVCLKCPWPAKSPAPVDMGVSLEPEEIDAGIINRPGERPKEVQSVR